MYTLNYKALFIKEIVLVFIKAIGIYLLLTVPALVAMPLIYEMSALYAISFGWIAGFLFLFIFYFLQKLHMDNNGKYFLCCMAVVLCVGIAFETMEVTGAQHHIWQSGTCLLFPLAAVLSGWLSLFISRQRINHLLAHSESNAN